MKILVGIDTQGYRPESQWKVWVYDPKTSKTTYYLGSQLFEGLSHETEILGLNQVYLKWDKRFDGSIIRYTVTKASELEYLYTVIGITDTTFTLVNGFGKRVKVSREDIVTYLMSRNKFTNIFIDPETKLVTIV